MSCAHVHCPQQVDINTYESSCQLSSLLGERKTSMNIQSTLHLCIASTFKSKFIGASCPFRFACHAAQRWRFLEKKVKNRCDECDSFCDSFFDSRDYSFATREKPWINPREACYNPSCITSSLVYVLKSFNTCTFIRMTTSAFCFRRRCNF